MVFVEVDFSFLAIEQLNSWMMYKKTCRTPQNTKTNRQIQAMVETTQAMARKNFTPLKFNVEPENQPLEKEIPIGNHHL